MTGVTVKCPDCKGLIAFMGNDTIYYAHKLLEGECNCNFCTAWKTRFDKKECQEIICTLKKQESELRTEGDRK